MMLCLDCIDDQCPHFGTDAYACEEYTSMVEQLDSDEKIERDKHFERDNDADYWMEQCIEAEQERDELKALVSSFIRAVQGVD